MSEPQTPMTDAEVAASTIPPAPDPAEVHPVHTILNDIEALAIRYGGEIMTEIRHLVAEGRALL